MPSEILIPPRLQELLAKSDCAGGVQSTCKLLGDWIGDNTRGLYFFPEYTDHGPKHVNSVLTACATLISDESCKLLMPDDAAVLVIGVLLHDAAMHLEADGFLTLLT